jgi:hypothetical protein
MVLYFPMNPTEIEHLLNWEYVIIFSDQLSKFQGLESWKIELPWRLRPSLGLSLCGAECCVANG